MDHWVLIYKIPIYKVNTFRNTYKSKEIKQPRAAASQRLLAVKLEHNEKHNQLTKSISFFAFITHVVFIRELPICFYIKDYHKRIKY